MLVLIALPWPRALTHGALPSLKKGKTAALVSQRPAISTMGKRAHSHLATAVKAHQTALSHKFPRIAGRGKGTHNEQRRDRARETFLGQDRRPHSVRPAVFRPTSSSSSGQEVVVMTLWTRRTKSGRDTVCNRGVLGTGTAGPGISAPLPCHEHTIHHASFGN